MVEGTSILFYNGGPCANNHILPNHTFTNGTVADATLLSIYEDYDTAFRTPVGRSNALGPLRAAWRDLSTYNSTRRIVGRNLIPFGGGGSLLAARQESGRLSSTQMRYLARLTVAVGAVGGTTGFAYAINTAGDAVRDVTGASASEVLLLKGAMFVCWFYVIKLIYDRLKRSADDIDARAASQAAVMLPTMRELSPEDQLDPLEDADLAAAYEALEEGRVSTVELQAVMPAGFDDAQNIERNVEEERGSCPSTSDSGPQGEEA